MLVHPNLENTDGNLLINPDTGNKLLDELKKRAFGSETFYELRKSYQKACIKTGYSGGQALEISVTEDSVINNLSSCGFGSCSVRSYNVVEGYDTVRDVLKLIRGMGAKNASSQRNRSLGVRKIWNEMINIYMQDFAIKGRIPATFEIIAGSAKTV